jgi:hypothetical protein
MVLGRVGSTGGWSMSCKMTWRLIHAASVLIANFKLIHYRGTGEKAGVGGFELAVVTLFISILSAWFYPKVAT